MRDVLHEWEKVNLVTLPGGGDRYRCARCGIEGVRRTLGSFVFVPRARRDLFYSCTGEAAKQDEPQSAPVSDFQPVPYILMRGLAVVGAERLEAGDVAFSCPCPEEYRDQFGKELWIMGTVPFRVLPREVSRAVKVGDGYDFAE